MKNYFIFKFEVVQRHSKKARYILWNLKAKTYLLERFFQEHPEGFREPTEVEHNILSLTLWSFFDSLESLLRMQKRDWDTIQYITKSLSSLLAYMFSVYLKRRIRMI